MQMIGVDSIDLKKTLAVLVLAFCTAQAGCWCDEESPTVVVSNNTSGLVSVHIETSNGTTIDIDDIEAGATSEEFLIPSGRTNLALVWGSIPVPYYCELKAEYCYDYELEFTGETLRIIPHER